MKTALLTFIALIAFAANSVLCRMALGPQAIDPSSFTAIRLLSGIVVFILILTFSDKAARPEQRSGSWLSAVMLFIYAAAFSFAYVSLNTAVGALILFGAVQLTMICAMLIKGKKLHLIEWSGVVCAFGGFIYLMLPDIDRPSVSGFVLMSCAGIAWGIYTLRGKMSRHPLRDTAYNFFKAAPFIALLTPMFISRVEISAEGAMLAIASGALASGLGYMIWYMALKGLSTTEAAVVQLSVPVIAALGGVVLMSEAITPRLGISGALILGGILSVILARKRSSSSQ